MASYAFISDLHIKKAHDEPSKVLRSFFSHEKVQNSDVVFLLGDIFDFLIGEHKAYIKEYAFFFESILELIENGKVIYFFEGNHDFHFSNTITSFLKSKTTNYQNFKYLKQGIFLKLDTKKAFICHGYEFDYDNKYFKRWYKIYTSTFMQILTSYIIPYNVLIKLASWASKDSKRRGRKTFDYESMKTKYIEGAKNLLKDKQVDLVIGGHTHIIEEHEFDNDTRYYNIGYPQKDRKFLYIKNDEINFINL